MNEYEGIDYHSDGMGRGQHAAICVKVYATIDVAPDHEPFAESAWETVQLTFWGEAACVAHEYGYSGVFSEGRSGGWLVPYYQRGMSSDEIARRNLGYSKRTRAVLFHGHWPGQGGELGYPEYPDMDEIGERSRFRAFQRRIEAMLEAVPLDIIAEAKFQYEMALEAVI